MYNLLTERGRPRLLNSAVPCGVAAAHSCHLSETSIHFNSPQLPLAIHFNQISKSNSLHSHQELAQQAPSSNPRITVHRQKLWILPTLTNRKPISSMLQRSATSLRHPLQSNLKKAYSLYSHEEPAQQAPSSNNILPLKALSPFNVNKPQANFNQISRKELPTLTSTMTARTPSSNCQDEFHSQILSILPTSKNREPSSSSQWRHVATCCRG